MHKRADIKIFKYFTILIVLLLPNISQAQTSPNSGVESAVKAVFANAPEMIQVAACESGFKQYNTDGSPFYDASRTYIGVFQIAEQAHRDNAIFLGMDLSTLDGNLAYAKHLYDAKGTSPWSGCVKNAVQSAATNASATGVVSMNFNIGMTNPQIRLIQQILNKLGFIVASSGPGSLGNETNYFGELTRQAIRKFQCAKGIVCDGSEATTGYGRIGPKTRAVLNAQ